VCAVALIGGSAAAGQQASAPGVSVNMVVTVEGKRGKTTPPLQPQDISVTEKNEKRPITGLTSLAGAPTQLLFLIDDSAQSNFDTQLESLRTFITSLPPSTEVAVGYMSYGMTKFTANFTTDHAAAAKSLRVAMGPGGADVSPYSSLSDAIKRWPAGAAQRKEVIMISSGIEGLGGGYTSENPYVDKGIDDAQRAGVVVYTIYTPSVGHYGHSFWRMNWGQNFLSQLSDETGGESYFLGFGPPVSFDPFLREIADRQSHQYMLTFLAAPERKAGLQSVKVQVIEKDASIAAADKVYVPAGM
jgi:VWFA-related protein